VIGLGRHQVGKTVHHYWLYKIC